MNIFPAGKIAMVGNGPGELGQGRGAEIDSHETVIRCNNYQLAGYEADYGARVTHWATTLHQAVHWREPSRFQRIYVTLPLFNLDFLRRHRRYYPGALDFNRAAELVGQAAFIPFAIYETVGRVSCGITLLYWLYRERGWSLADVDVYGFSFFDPAQRMHYFDPAAPSDCQHNPETELAIYNHMREGSLK